MHGRQVYPQSQSSEAALRIPQYPPPAGCRTHHISLPRSTPSSSAKTGAGYPVPNAQSSRHIYEILNESSRHSCPISIPANRRQVLHQHTRGRTSVSGHLSQIESAKCLYRVFFLATVLIMGLTIPQHPHYSSNVKKIKANQSI